VAWHQLPEGQRPHLGYSSGASVTTILMWWIFVTGFSPQDFLSWQNFSSFTLGVRSTEYQVVDLTQTNT